MYWKRIAFVIILVLALLGFGGFQLATKVIIPRVEYNKAVSKMEAGDYKAAYEMFEELGDYKDCREQMESIAAEYKKQQLATAEVGDMLLFGTYEQDNDLTNGAEDIEWVVLEKEGTRLLIISEYALNDMGYNTRYQKATWEDSTVRIWLNGEFLEEAFDETQQAMIQDTVVTADPNPKYSEDPGADTVDKIYLMSIAEAEHYYAKNGDRRCKASPYAISLGAFVSEVSKSTWWWLRTPGGEPQDAAIVYGDGSIRYFGSDVFHSREGVRPMMWIDTAK